MRTMFTIVFVFAFIFSYAQQQQPSAAKELSAGDYLIKAGQQKNMAIFIFLGGGLLSGLSAAVADDPAGPVAIAVLSTGTALTYDILSNYNLKKAGKKLNESKIGIASSGIGIKYKF